MVEAVVMNVVNDDCSAFSAQIKGKTKKRKARSMSANLTDAALKAMQKADLITEVKSLRAEKAKLAEEKQKLEDKAQHPGARLDMAHDKLLAVTGLSSVEAVSAMSVGDLAKLRSAMTAAPAAPSTTPATPAAISFTPTVNGAT